MAVRMCSTAGHLRTTLQLAKEVAIFRACLAACRRGTEVGMGRSSYPEASVAASAVRGGTARRCTRSPRTMRFVSTAEVLANCKLKYYRISECPVKLVE